MSWPLAGNGGGTPAAVPTRIRAMAWAPAPETTAAVGGGVSPPWRRAWCKGGATPPAGGPAMWNRSPILIRIITRPPRRARGGVFPGRRATKLYG